MVMESGMNMYDRLFVRSAAAVGETAFPTITTAAELPPGHKCCSISRGFHRRRRQQQQSHMLLLLLSQ
jgi:hypothetical protein